MKIVIADASRLVCEGVQQIIASAEEVEVVGLAESCEEAARLLSAESGAMLVTGVRLRDGDAARLVRMARKRAPEARCVVLAADGETSHLRRAIEEGAASVCAVEDAHRRLPVILRSLEMGLSAIPTEMLSALMARGADPLTRREHEILTLLAEGLTNFQLSARLGVSENTIKYHLKTIYQKLGVNARAAAIAKYLSGKF